VPLACVCALGANSRKVGFAASSLPNFPITRFPREWLLHSMVRNPAMPTKTAENATCRSLECLKRGSGEKSLARHPVASRGNGRPRLHYRLTAAAYSCCSWLPGHAAPVPPAESQRFHVAIVLVDFVWVTIILSGHKQDWNASSAGEPRSVEILRATATRFPLSQERRQNIATTKLSRV
jgi:hypothetical protein